MNKLTIIGCLGRDPETRTTQNGSTVCSFSVATTERYKDQEKTTWFKVAAFGKLGEACQKYLSKGKRCAVVGSVSVSTYDGRDGKTYTSLDVLASDVEFLSPKEQSDADEPANRYDEKVPDDQDNDLPF
jgi:single-strand DNA-binding protein